jgi:cytidylate kinase
MRDLPARTSHAFTITVSREAGTLGTSIAEEIGRRLGWHVYDHELLEQIAKEMSVRTTLLESVDERQQNWLMESIEAFLATPTKSEWEPYVSEGAFVRHLIETVLALGVHGECVIVGRGAAFILPARTTLRVRLVAPLNERIARMSELLGISTKEAARQVKTIDRERVGFVRGHFQKDPTDARQYDLVLNAGRLTVCAQAELVIDALCHLKSCAGQQAVEQKPSFS